MKTFHTIFRPEPEGGFTAFVPSLLGCISYGTNLEEAEKNIQEAIELYLAVRENETLIDDSNSFLRSYSYA